MMVGRRTRIASVAGCVRPPAFALLPPLHDASADRHSFSDGGRRGMPPRDARRRQPDVRPRDASIAETSKTARAADSAAARVEIPAMTTRFIFTRSRDVAAPDRV